MTWQSLIVYSRSILFFTNLLLYTVLTTYESGTPAFRSDDFANWVVSVLSWEAEIAENVLAVEPPSASTLTDKFSKEDK